MVLAGSLADYVLADTIVNTDHHYEEGKGSSKKVWNKKKSVF